MALLEGRKQADAKLISARGKVCWLAQPLPLCRRPSPGLAPSLSFCPAHLSLPQLELCKTKFLQLHGKYKKAKAELKLERQRRQAATRGAEQEIAALRQCIDELQVWVWWWRCRGGRRTHP